MTITSPTTTRDAHGNEISGAADDGRRLRPCARPAAAVPPRPCARRRRDRRRSGGPAHGAGLHGLPHAHVDGRPRRRGGEGRGGPARGVAAQRAGGGPCCGSHRLGRGTLARRSPHARRPARPVADRRARPADGPPARLLRRRRPEPARPCRPLAVELRSRSPAHRVRAGHARLRARRVRPLRPGRARRPRRGRAQPRRRVGHPRGRPHVRDAGQGRRRHPLPAQPGDRLGDRQPVHGAQLVAPCAVPPRGRPPRRGAGDLRRAGPPRRVRRRAARDARRQRPPVAAHARRDRHRRTVRIRSRTRGRAGSAATRGTRSTTCTR